MAALISEPRKENSNFNKLYTLLSLVHKFQNIRIYFIGILCFLAKDFLKVFHC